MENFRILKDFQWVSLVNLLRKPIENASKSENFPLFQELELFRDFFRFRKKNETEFLNPKFVQESKNQA